MCDTPKTNRDALWADSGTGDQFKCVHIDDAIEMEAMLRKARNVLDDWCDEYGHLELEEMRNKIDLFLST